MPCWRISRGPHALVAALAICLSVSAATAAPRARAAATRPAATHADPYNGLKLRNIGPAMTSGRIADIAIVQSSPDTWYIGVASGGVWKTTNSGTTWKPIFEHEGSYSIGCVTVDPQHPEIVWVGTGENNSGRHVGYGDGVYRSVDAGATWKNMGLPKSEHIGKIVVDPHDSQVVYVAAQGPLWSAGGDRGLFKTTDGGATWKKVLGGGDYTGVADVVMDPRDPDVLYAATWQHFRDVAALIDGGPESAIYKTTDGGATWVKLTQGLPKGQLGRIGLAISPQKPDVVYATIELPHRKGGFWRSTDAGGSWEKRSDHIAGSTGPHYYQEIFASPYQFDRVYHTEMELNVTEDGGKTFRNIHGRFKHVDNHAVAFRPDDPNYLLVGCDGGLYESFDLGETWKYVANLPVTQFYKVAVDNDTPFYNVYGGAQDNNTQGGPSRTDNMQGIRNSDWFVTMGGDGYMPATDPSNPDIVYSEFQEGRIARFDRKTGEIVFIQPQPGPGAPAERFAWDAPIEVSPQDPATLYYASQRVWRSDDHGDSWRPISGDLTRGLDRLKLPMMGRVWSFDALWDVMAMSKYGTITALVQSPVDANLLYAGTDDGLIRVTEDGGRTWRRIDRLPGVPGFFFVNDLKADLHDSNVVYAAVDAHKQGDFSPYLFKSSDRGRSWKRITTGIPDRTIVWRVVQDDVDPQLLFAGTEFGLYVTVDGGASWNALTGGVPHIPFRDVVIQRRESDLVAGSFGRGIYILDDFTPLRHVAEGALDKAAALFPVRKAWWYIPRRTLGFGPKGSQGDAFFTAPNPPFGAVFTYHLKDDLRSSKEVRQAKEKKIAKEGGDAPYPGWDELRNESLEKGPMILLTVRDSDGHIVRRITGPAKKGFHRVAWDLRRPPVTPAPLKPAGAEEEGGFRDRRGVLAAPGTYSVSLAKIVNGTVTDFGESQTFDVVPLRKGTLPGSTPKEAADFLARVADLNRQIEGAGALITETSHRIDGMHDALMRSSVDDPALIHDVDALRKRLADIQLALSGDRTRRLYGDDGPVSVNDRIGAVSSITRFSTYGPTPTARESFELAQKQFETVRAELGALTGTDLPAIEKRIEAAGAPWIPGSGVPEGSKP